MGAFCGSLLFFAKSAASDFGCRKVWNRQEYVNRISWGSNSPFRTNYLGCVCISFQS